MKQNKPKTKRKPLSCDISGPMGRKTTVIAVLHGDRDDEHDCAGTFSTKMKGVFRPLAAYTSKGTSLVICCLTIPVIRSFPEVRYDVTELSSSMGLQEAGQ